jgi:anti-sigma B factor antagonist
MATKALEANVRQAGPVAVIDLRGELDLFGEETLNAAYGQAEAQDPKAVLLNFTGVDYINSTGIALIVGLLARARKAGRRLLTSGLSSHYVEIFQITRLADFMNIYPDEATALAQAV